MRRRSTRNPSSHPKRKRWHRPGEEPTGERNHDGFQGRQRRPGQRDNRRGGRRGPPPKKTPLVAAPDVLWGLVTEIGAQIIVRIFHKELSNLNVFLDKSGEDLIEQEVVQIRIGRQDKFGRVEGRLVARHGTNPAGLASLIACANFGLDLHFPSSVLQESEDLKAWCWDAKEGREDWRALPIVTIDGVDARDFDDAVWVGDTDADGLTEVRVAIADVAHYIRPGSILDREAEARGNSTYFPDRVIPMLPERLSNDLCSLRPQEDRPVLGVVMQVDKAGRLKGKRFVRAAICSAARLTYDDVSDVIEGKIKTHPRKAEIDRLHEVFERLVKAREMRGALDLDVGEVKVEVDDRGEVVKVAERPRRDAERVIEELMIAANVAAAEVLSIKGGGVYRIHDMPTKEKVETLRATLGPLGFTVPSHDAGHRAWAKLVAQVKDHAAGQQLLRAVLQTQQQAKYDPVNIGHYGLALPQYSHFTSPIRRYADLLVHRALVAKLKLAGDGGHTEDGGALARACEGVNLRERISQQAEWEAKDRLIVQYFAKLAEKAADTVFDGVVVNSQKFGVFVAVQGVAEGLLPIEALRGAKYDWVPRFGLFKKGKGKDMLRLGARVKVVLLDADRVRGRITWGLPS